MLLSGSVGYTLLQNNNKYVLVFSDIHDDVSYCQSNKSLDMSDFLNSRSSNSQILLEEANRDNVKLQELWPTSDHTQKLKLLAINNPDEIIPVDIRPKLILFSWELIDKNKELQNIKLKKYLELINNFFNKSSQLYIDLFEKEINKMNKENHQEIFLFFNTVREDYIQFLTNNKNLLNLNLIKIKNTNIDILDYINNLCSFIMEWYIIILIYNNKKNSIVHVGLIHSNRLIDILIKIYKFKKISEKGINLFEQTLFINKPSSCILLPNNIKNIFKKKIGFF